MFFSFSVGFPPDTTGSIKKSGGIFKERLRDLGGLDSVFEVAAECYSNIEV